MFVFYLQTLSLMGKRLCGKCAEGNGGGCIGICPDKSIKIAIMVAGLLVDRYPGPPEHEAGVAMFNIKFYDSYWDYLT